MAPSPGQLSRGSILLCSPGSRRMGSTHPPAFLRLVLVTENAVSARVTAVQHHSAGCFVTGPGVQQQVGGL